MQVNAWKHPSYILSFYGDNVKKGNGPWVDHFPFSYSDSSLLQFLLKKLKWEKEFEWIESKVRRSIIYFYVL
ncbi:hypothetical protein CHH55_21080 [Niallia circulans]|nr:hypothetical protein CHH55_21080 [Niallia circulans]